MCMVYEANYVNYNEVETLIILHFLLIKKLDS